MSSCAPALHHSRPLSGLEARYVAYAHEPARRAATATATRAYRGILAQSLGSRCRMLPSDSQLFDRRARICGATTATALGVARLYLEVAASPATLPSLLADGRVRWLDVPRVEECGP